MPAILKWNGSAVGREVRDVVFGIAERAAETLASEIRKKIGTPGPPASPHGSYPFKQSGDLQNSIEVISNSSTMAISVVSTSDYAEYVERSRPFFRRAFQETLPMLQRQVKADAARNQL